MSNYIDTGIKLEDISSISLVSKTPPFLKISGVTYNFMSRTNFTYDGKYHNFEVRDGKYFIDDVEQTPKLPQYLNTIKQLSDYGEIKSFTIEEKNGEKIVFDFEDIKE